MTMCAVVNREQFPLSSARAYIKTLWLSNFAGIYDKAALTELQ